MAAKVRAKPIKTPPFVLSYPHLLTPQEFPAKPGEKPQAPQYNCVAIFGPNVDLSELYAAAKETKAAFFGKSVPRGLRAPFRKCEEFWEEDTSTGKLIPQAGYVAGGMAFPLNAGKMKPDCRDAKMLPITDASILYAGCVCRAVIRPYGYDNMGNKGVKFALLTLQKIGEGENIAGRVNADDYFEEVEELADNATTGKTTGDGWDEEDETF